MFAVLIQPFHCLIFVIFVSTAISSLNGTFASAVFAIVTIWFMFQAEKIIKTIFGFRQPATMGDAVKSVATVMAGAKLMTSLGQKAGQKIATGNSPKQYWNNTKAGVSGNTGNSGNQNTTNGQSNSTNQNNQSNSNNQGSQNNSGNQSSPNNGTRTTRNSGWTQYKRRHPNVATGLTIARKAPLKALKWGTAVGVAALGVGNNNLLSSVQMATGVNGAMNGVGQGIKQRKYAQSLNNDLYLAGEKYDRRVENVVAQITAEKGTEIEERIMRRLMKQGMDNIEAKEQAHEQAQKQILQTATTQVNKEIFRAINEPNINRINDQEVRELAMILQGCVDKYQKLGTDKDKAQQQAYKDITGEKT